MPEFVLDTQGAVIRHDGAPIHFYNDLDAFTQGYIEALFFTWPDDEGDYIGGITSPGFADLAPETLAGIIEDCRQFQEDMQEALSAACGHEFPARVIGDGTLPDSHRPAWQYDAKAAGRDFWYTRNGHGVGFWDRDLGEVGDILSAAARSMGSCDACLGDDGKVYLA